VIEQLSFDAMAAQDAYDDLLSAAVNTHGGPCPRRKSIEKTVTALQRSSITGAILGMAMLVLLAVFFLLAHYLFSRVWTLHHPLCYPRWDDLFCEPAWVQVHGRADHMGSDLGSCDDQRPRGVEAKPSL